MRVLAARFPDRGRAAAVRDLLFRELDGARDLDIAPLGVLGQASSTETLLAGRFPEDETRRVAEVVIACGGEIVANVDESWTRPRIAPQRTGRLTNFIRGGLHAST